MVLTEATRFQELNAALIAETKRELLARFATIEIDDDPWLHASVPGFLPPRLYASLVHALRAQDRSKMGDGGNGRHWLTVHPQTFSCAASLKADLSFWDTRLHPLLSLAMSCFSDVAVRDALFSRFKPAQADTVERALRIERKTRRPLTVEVRLVYDDPAYDLPVHTDIRKKIFSILVYVPLDRSSKADGTSLYAPLEAALADDGRQYMPVDRFELRKTMPFAANQAFMFFRTDTSFHGKPRVPSTVRSDRYSLQVNYLYPGTHLSTWNNPAGTEQPATEATPQDRTSKNSTGS